MDRSWMTKSRVSEEYQNGLKSFLDFSFSNASIDGRILCPCKHCKIGVFVTREEAFEHLTIEGFILGYTQWIAHGELPRSHSSGAQTFHDIPETSEHIDDMQGLVYGALGVQQEDVNLQDTDGFSIDEDIAGGPAGKFYQLIDSSQQKLYEGCDKFTKLSFIIRLLHLKCLGRLSNKVFDMLLGLLREAFPDAMTGLPKSYYEAEKLMRELGLGHEKIDACPNDCTLYWGPNEGRTSCETCKELRWCTSNKDPRGEKRKIARKVLWYFPIKPRLQRLFMSAKTACHMRWHYESRTKDGCMRHPADSPAWQTFDSLHPEFAKDPRNIRLGLASDGFNPFKNMSVSHSTWPVILIPYNLPPWMCMKQPNLMLSLLIPGPSGPGNNIDIYLQPLIAEKWILSSIGHKWRNWKHILKIKYWKPNVSVKSLLHKKDERVLLDQWTKLLTHWNTGEAKKVSKQNTEARTKKIMDQLTGKTSFAQVREILTKKLGRPPTRFEMFGACYVNPNGRSSPALVKFLEMEERSKQLPEGSEDAIGPDDVFAQTMGNDRLGYVRMLGQGICPSDVWGELPHKKSTHLLMEQQSRIAHLEKMLLVQQRCGPSQVNSSQQVSASNPLSDQAAANLPLLVGAFVSLKSLFNPTKTVAKGYIHSTSPSTEVGGHILGSNWCEVNVKVIPEPTEQLIRPYDSLLTMADTLGEMIAWPCHLVTPSED